MRVSRLAQLESGVRAASRAFSRWFPAPAMLVPDAIGIDISDASIKWIVLDPLHETRRVVSWGDVSLPDGVVVRGVVQDAEALASALREVRDHLGGSVCAHAALPEEAAYVFSMHVPEGTPHDQVLRMIEFEFEGRVPIKPTAAVYDFDVILRHDDGEGEEIGVSVFPRDLAEEYVRAFALAGITLVSLEIEARSIGRAVSSGLSDEPITLLVDFGRARTGFAVLKHGIPIFTSTVEVGGDAIERMLIEKFSLSPEAAEAFRNERGLCSDDKKSPEAEALVGTASALADEVARHFHYWDTRRNERGERMTPVGRVLLVGGSANLLGLPDYIASRVQAPTELGDVWQHVADFRSYIPPIDRRRSLQFATAIGLALRTFV